MGCNEMVIWSTILQRTFQRRPQSHGQRILLTIAILGLVASAQDSSATDFASSVPDDAVLFAQWSGVQIFDHGAGAATPLGKMLADPEFKRLGQAIQKSVDWLVKNYASGDDPESQAMKAGLGLANTLWQRGGMVALLGIDTEAGMPSPQLIIAIEAGSVPTEILADVEALLGLVPQLGAPTEVEIGGTKMNLRPGIVEVITGVVDEFVLVAIGQATVERFMGTQAGSGANLASSSPYSSALEKMGAKKGTGLLTVHLNVVKLLVVVQQGFSAAMGQEQLPPPVQTVLDGLGITSVQSVTVHEQFTGKGHRHSLYIAAPGEKRGLLKLFGSVPLTAEDLVAIPADATLAKASNLDLSMVYEEMMGLVDLLAVVDPSIPAEIHGGVEEVEAALGMKIKEDILDQFGDTWVFFDATSSGGLFGSGMTAVIETKNPEKVQALIRRGIDTLFTEMGLSAGAGIQTYDHRDHPIHFINVTLGPSPVAPAWAFHKERLIVALYPQAVAQTIERLASDSAASLSILESRDFAQGRQGLTKNCNTLVYLDTPKSVSDLYAISLPLVSAGCSMAQQAGAPLDVSIWPRREVWMRNLSPDLWAVSTDDGGILVCGIGPLPVPVPSPTWFAPWLGVAAATVLPNFMMSSGSAEMPNADFSDEDMENLRAIGYVSDESDNVAAEEAVPEPETLDDFESKLSNLGVHCQLYAMQNREAYPPTLDDLLGPDGPSAEEIDLGQSCTYIPGHTSKSSPQSTLIHCSNQDGSGWVLRVDGTVVELDEAMYREAVGHAAP